MHIIYYNYVLVVIKLELKVEKPKRTRADAGSIGVKKLRNREARWQFQARLRSRYTYNMVRQTVGKDVEVAWEELKEGILRSAVEVCGGSRARRKRRRTAWWSKEVQEAVRAKKLAY